jgi:hypothetical protein
MLYVCMYVFIKILFCIEWKLCFCCRWNLWRIFMLRSCIFFVIFYGKNVNKILDSESLTLSTSFQMRSCSEIDINILFVFNTKCIYPIGHFRMNVSSREASRIDIKSTRHILVLYKFSAEANFSTVHSLDGVWAGIGSVAGWVCWMRFLRMFLHELWRVLLINFETFLQSVI